MRNRLLAIAAITVLLWPAAVLANEDFLWAGGYGHLKVGATRAQVDEFYEPIREDLGAGVAWFVPGAGDDPKTCAEYELYAGSGRFLMFRGGRLSRISTTRPGYFTQGGIQVGSPESDVLRAFPRHEREPAPYADAPAHDLYVWETPKRGLRFEIDDQGKVAAIHAGGESIRYMEGCL